MFSDQQIAGSSFIRTYKDNPIFRHFMKHYIYGGRISPKRSYRLARCPGCKCCRGWVVNVHGHAFYYACRCWNIKNELVNESWDYIFRIFDHNPPLKDFLLAFGMDAVAVEEMHETSDTEVKG